MTVKSLASVGMRQAYQVLRAAVDQQQWRPATTDDSMEADESPKLTRASSASALLDCARVCCWAGHGRIART